MASPLDSEDAVSVFLSVPEPLDGPAMLWYTH